MSGRSPSKVKIFVISLERDELRRSALMRQLRDYGCFDVELCSGIDGTRLPDFARRALVADQEWATNRGTIGCFLSHASAWQMIVESDVDYGIVLEDDVETIKLQQFRSISLPPDADLIFINERMTLNGEHDVITVVELIEILHRIDSGQSSLGGDGYCLSRRGAQTALKALEHDLCFGHVDGRLLRYACAEDDLSRLPKNSRIAEVIRNHHNSSRPPSMGILKAFSLSAPFVKHRGVKSIREASDRQSLSDSGQVFSTADVPDPAADIINTGNQVEYGSIPVRYWDRVRNVGDSINPYLIELVSGYKPYFEFDPKKAHVLGVGSIFNMATTQSYIWGSGLHSPNANDLHFDPAKVRAVRGRLTRDLLRDAYGLPDDVVLGDPGILIGNLPAFRNWRSSSHRQWRVAVVPHHSMIDDPELAKLAVDPELIVLRPGLPAIEFLRKLSQADYVVSASLHGLIFAQALNIPYTWITNRIDDRWLFKFNDWFTNLVVDTPKPLPFGSDIATLLAEARTYEVGCDLVQLRNCLPRLVGHRQRPDQPEPGTSRKYTPMTVFVSTGFTKPSSRYYDVTIDCVAGDVDSLQSALNALAKLMSGAEPILLVFDEDRLERLPFGCISGGLELLDGISPLHYLQFLERYSEPRRPQDDLVSIASFDIEMTFRRRQITLGEIERADFWHGVLLVRHPASFHFDAPGMSMSPV